MSESYIDAYDLIKEECQRICDEITLLCSDCRVKWICNSTHSPIPSKWPKWEDAKRNT